MPPSASTVYFLPKELNLLLIFSVAALLPAAPEDLKTSSIVISRRPSVLPALFMALRIAFDISPSLPVILFAKPSISERLVRPYSASSIIASSRPLMRSLRRIVPYWLRTFSVTVLRSSRARLSIYSWRLRASYSGVPFWISGVSSVGATWAGVAGAGRFCADLPGRIRLVYTVSSLGVPSKPTSIGLRSDG